MLIAAGIFIVIVIVIPALLIQRMSSNAAESRLKVGDHAPDFTLSDQNGHTVHLADYRGKNLLIFMWASW